jgi:hypothetical protein
LEDPDDSAIDTNETIDIWKRFVNINATRVGVGRSIDTPFGGDVTIASDQDTDEGRTANESKGPVSQE